MRILFLTPNLGSGGGGAERQIVTVACALKKRGLDCEFLCYCEGDFYAPILEKKGISIQWLLQPQYVKRTCSVRQFIRKGHYDAVISFLQTPGFLNCFSAVGGKKWKVITGERSSVQGFFSTRKGRLYCKFQRFSDAIVCNSDNARQMWVRHNPHYSNKLKVIYNAVSLQPITSVYVPRRDGRLHVVVAASYQYLKNPIGLIKALSLLPKNERSCLSVDWYGKFEVEGGDAKAYCESLQLIETYGLQDVITLHGPCSDIQNKMNEADVVGLFSMLEGLPNAVCEAMTIGKPIIMTKVSDYKTLVDVSNGFLCEWDDPLSIANAIKSALSVDNDDLLRMGASSRLKAMKLFSEENVAEQWIQLLG